MFKLLLIKCLFMQISLHAVAHKTNALLLNIDKSWCGVAGNTFLLYLLLESEDS